MIYSLSEIISSAKENSPYYSELYKNISKGLKLTELPVVDLEKFWSRPVKEHILTGPVNDGVVFKSGGTSGSPKYSYFTKDEWKEFTTIFGVGLVNNGLENGDRVGNLFYAGNLYASFMFIMNSIENSPLDLIHYPLTGTIEFSECVNTVKDQNINVLAGVPTTFINLASYVLENGIELPLKKIFFGGEPLYDDQALMLRKSFPGVKLYSIGYASVDGGHLGYFDKDLCENFEHRPFSKSSILEIVDPDTFEPVTTPGAAGLLVYTNLARKLMPIIRYPVGDMGYFTGKSDIFRLIGRSDSGARIGPVTLTRSDILSVLDVAKVSEQVSTFQMVIDHNDGVDQLTLNLLFQGKPDSCSLDNIKEILYVERKMLKDSVEKNIIAPVLVRSITTEQLMVNERTGKQRLVIDRRC